MRIWPLRPALSSRFFLIVPLLCVCGASGCRKKEPLPSQSTPIEERSADEPEEPPPPIKKPAEPSRCRESSPGSLFVVGQVAADKPRVEGDDEDEPIALPYGVELGGAVGYAGGFAAGFLQSERGRQRASVAFVGAGGSGRAVELGPVHGDVEPPLLALAGQRVVVLFGDQDAAGATWRTAFLDLSAERPAFGPELLEVDRFSGAALSASGNTALVVFARAQKGKARLFALRWDAETGKPLGEVEQVQSASLEPESPRLVRRPGGYWLSWVEQGASRAQRKAPSVTPSTASRGERPEASPWGDEPGGLELGPRALKLVALDENARPLGDPLSLTKPDSHVVAYELAPWSDGGAVLAFRDDLTGPGVEGGGLHMARVRPDGSVENGVLEDAELGAGAPALLLDAAPRSPGANVWLIAGAESGKTRFALLTGGGTTATALAGDPLVGGAELMAVHGGRLLAARPRQTAQDLSVLECAIMTK